MKATMLNRLPGQASQSVLVSPAFINLGVSALDIVSIAWLYIEDGGQVVRCQGWFAGQNKWVPNAR
jgi:hypothetical protein